MREIGLELPGIEAEREAGLANGERGLANGEERKVWKKRADRRGQRATS